MKKCIFHFCTAESGTLNAMCGASNRLPASPSARTKVGVRCPLSWQYFIRGIRIKVLPILGYRTPSWQCITRGRVAPKLACVQDIRPHVPELGCTSAVQNEKMYFSFLYCCCSFWHEMCERKLTERRVPRRHHQMGFDTPSLQIFVVPRIKYCQLGVSTPSWQCRRGDASPPS